MSAAEYILLPRHVLLGLLIALAIFAVIRSRTRIERYLVVACAGAILGWWFHAQYQGYGLRFRPLTRAPESVASADQPGTKAAPSPSHLPVGPSNARRADVPAETTPEVAQAISETAVPADVANRGSETAAFVGGVPTEPDISAGSSADRDVIDYRQDMMKTLDEQAASLGEMASGVIPQDNMGAHMQMLALAASMGVKAFAPNVPGGKAKPDVWSNWNDFSKKMTDFAQKAAAGAQAQGVDAQLSALVDIANGCKGCHDVYREKQD